MRALAAGFQEPLVKPVDPARVVAAIQELLSGSRSLVTR
jgi:DNA-binding response OmpR family regulator